MEIHKDFFQTKALNFKTPASKCKCGSEDGESLSQSLLDVSPYLPFFKEDAEAPISGIGHVAGVLVRLLDKGIMSNNEMIINLVNDYRNEHGKAGDAIRALWLSMEALSTLVGYVPT
jgi:hypothetical protein